MEKLHFSKNLHTKFPYLKTYNLKAIFLIEAQKQHFPILLPDRWSSELLDFCDRCLAIKVVLYSDY